MNTNKDDDDGMPAVADDDLPVVADDGMPAVADDDNNEDEIKLEVEVDEVVEVNDEPEKMLGSFHGNGPEDDEEEEVKEIPLDAK